MHIYGVCAMPLFCWLSYRRDSDQTVTQRKMSALCLFLFNIWATCVAARAPFQTFLTCLLLRWQKIIRSQTVAPCTQWSGVQTWPLINPPFVFWSLWYSPNGLKGEDRRMMGKKVVGVPFYQVEIRWQKVKAGSGEEVVEVVWCKRQRWEPALFPPSPSPPCAGQVDMRW